MAEREEEIEVVLMQESMKELCSISVAHDLNKKVRSADVTVEGSESDIDFNGLQLSEDVVKGLKFCGFEKPSPIQLRAIPLGRLGFDLLLQAKSGTGKTCVFSVIALERVDLLLEKIQVLVLCPSREIAFQSKHVIRSIGVLKSGMKVKTFIGGRPIEKDLRRLKECHIALGTPGRIAHLLRDHEMDLSGLRVFVLDEADKLLDDSFFVDLKYIYDATPPARQMIAASATYPNGLDHFILRFMNTPIKVQLDAAAPVLLAVDQFALDVRRICDYEPTADQSVKAEDISNLKLRCLKDLVKRVPFSQGIIFSQFQLKAERVYDELRSAGIDVVLMSGALSQKDRLESMDQFQQGKCRLMVATDLVARGFDCESVDLVINFECPLDISTYIHRMGRAGRFGSFGSVVTLLGFHNDWTQIQKYQAQVNLDVNLVRTFTELEAIGIPKSKDRESNESLFVPRSAEPDTEDSENPKQRSLTPLEAFDLAQFWAHNNKTYAYTCAWGLTISEEEAALCMEDPCDEWKAVLAAHAAKEKSEADAEAAAAAAAPNENGGEGSSNSAEDAVDDDPKKSTPATELGTEADLQHVIPVKEASGYSFTSEVLKSKTEQERDSNSLDSAVNLSGQRSGPGRVLSQGIRGGRSTTGISRSDLRSQLAKVKKHEVAQSPDTDSDSSTDESFNW